MFATYAYLVLDWGHICYQFEKPNCKQKANFETKSYRTAAEI